MENIEILELIKNGQPVTEEQLKLLKGPTPDGDSFVVVTEKPLRMGIPTESLLDFYETVIANNLNETADIADKSIVGTNFYDARVSDLSRVSVARQNGDEYLWPVSYYNAGSNPLRLYPNISAENFDRLENILTRLIESSLQPAKIINSIPQYDEDYSRLGD